MPSRRKFTYLLLRYSSLFISFLLSIFYTPKLGFTNKGILSFILLITGVLIPMLSQGMRLTLRRFYLNYPYKNVLSFAYIKAVFTHALLGLILINIILFLFLSRLNHLEPSIFFVVNCYFMTAFGAQVFYDYLLSTSNYRLLNIKIFTESMLLISTFFALERLPYFSLFVNILLSFIISYTVGGFLIPLVFYRYSNIKVLPMKTMFYPNDSTSQTSFYRSFFPSSILIVIDRLDKFIVFLAFPIEVFSKIVLAQSFIAFVKPAQDIVVNFVSSRSVIKFKHHLILLGVSLSLIINPAIFVIYNLVLDNFFGSEWKLGAEIFMSLFFLEIIKFILLVSISKVYIDRSEIIGILHMITFYCTVALLSLGTILLMAPLQLVILLLMTVYFCCITILARLSVF